MKTNQHSRECKGFATSGLIALTTIILFVSSQNVRAQWNQSGNNITTTNNVGIGTTAPTQLLHLKKDQDTNTMILVDNWSMVEALRLAFE